MKKLLMVSVMALSATFASYGYTAEEHSHGHDNQGTSTSIPSLSLNNGERWEMDDHTRKLSKKMSKTFFSADHSTLEGLQTAGKALDQQMQELIAGCTMTGRAHDQLHLFLSDHIPTITAMAKANEYTIARENAIRLKGQLENYQRHFK
jgi:hypothetical protein